MTHRSVPWISPPSSTEVISLQYLGLHPNVFKNQASEGVNYVNTAHQVVTGLTPVLGAFGLAKNKGETGKGERKVLTSSSTTPSKASTSSPWAKWAAIGGAVVASGAAATAWYHREQLTNGVAYGWNYLTDQYVLRASVCARV